MRHAILGPRLLPPQIGLGESAAVGPPSQSQGESHSAALDGVRERMARLRAVVGDRATTRVARSRSPSPPRSSGPLGAAGGRPGVLYLVDDGLVVRERMALLKVAVGDKAEPFAAPHAALQLSQPSERPVVDSPATSHRKVATSQSPEAQRGLKTFEAVTNRRGGGGGGSGDGGDDTPVGDVPPATNRTVGDVPVAVVPDGAVRPWAAAPAAAPTSADEPTARRPSSQGNDAPLENVREKMTRLRAEIKVSNSSTYASLDAGGAPPPPAPPTRGAVPPPPAAASAPGVNLDYIDMELDDDQPGSIPRAGATPRAATAVTNQPGQLEEKREDDLEDALRRRAGRHKRR